MWANARLILMAKMQRGCELCDGVAALHCAADDAHICWTCDAKVHSANFLVARHTRSVLCGTCGTPTPWRASGANPTPLTGLCANCSQGESQGECTTHDDGAALDTRRAASRLSPTHVVGRSVSGHESGCSTSNAERCDGKVVEGDTVRAFPCESASQLSSEDVEGTSDSVQASVFSGISKLLQRKRLNYCSPGAVPQNKQIVGSALVDVNRSVAHEQVTSSSSLSLP